jgi:cell division protease FtsH
MNGEGDDPSRGKRRLPPSDDRGGRRPSPIMTPRPLKTLVFWLMMTVLVLVAVNVYHLSRPEERKLTYSDLYAQVEKGNIESIVISEHEARGELKEPVSVTAGNRTESIKRFITLLPMADAAPLVAKVQETNPKAVVDGAKEKPNWFGVVLTYLPILLIIGFWLFFIRQMQSGGSAALKFGKSRAKLLVENKPRVTFKDVAGADEAKEELQEIIEFLKDPKKFQTLGGRIPKGALLLGPPGTGKTLLAKAVAGEAAVPFFSMSGSDFVEMFVGVGASRVRDLFEQGKRNAPCIIFIDEIDAVGRHRGAGLGGGHDEREQTLNQLLVEMDGFESNEGVILIAATNRPDVLDPALLRPGRFDRQIVVDAPDVKGREAILRIHTRKIPISEDVDLSVIARGTPGMVGADLANMVNEAALLAARRNHRRVTMLDFEDSKDKVMMGAERKSRIISDDEKKVTAYHEAGHTLVGKLTPGADPIHKVTIVPRGRALGVTHFLPIDERHTYTKEYCEGILARMLGGRAAEEVIFGHITTGAGNDIEQATVLARKMVCEWGMSDELGPLKYGKKEEMIFLGKEIAHERDYSEATQQRIDREVRRFVEEGHERALTILRSNEETLHSLAKALLEREILDALEIDRILKGESLEPETEAPPAAAEPAAPSPPTPREKETPEPRGGIHPTPEPGPA